MIRLLLAGSHALARQGLRRILEQDREIRIVGEGDGLAALADGLRRGAADLLLVDTAGLGDQLDRLLSSGGSDRLARIIWLEEQPDLARVAEALMAGVGGVLSKSIAADALVAAVRAGGQGVGVLDRELARELATRTAASLGPRPGPAERVALAGLTPREREVLELLAKGMSTQEIADALVVSPKTVRNHVSRCMTKLGARSRTALLLAALGAINSQLGMISPAQETGGPES